MKLEFKIETQGWMAMLISKEERPPIKILFPYSSSTVWCDEVRNFRIQWSMENFGSLVNVTIHEDAVYNSGNPQMLFDGEIELKGLLKHILISLHDLLRDFGLCGYKKVWEVGNFPIADYLELKSYFTGDKSIPIPTEEDESWRGKVRLEEELALSQIPLQMDQ